MRSTTGDHWIALDHIRAVAVYLVFCWHFLHWNTGYPVPFEAAPIFPIATLIEEGHVGVALFMVLSGYLFAKLLHGRRLFYRAFVYNRALRLLPLLLITMTLVAVQRLRAGLPLSNYARDLLFGFVAPVWPNGGWSIAVEIHFYILLPVVLFVGRRDSRWLLAMIGGALIVRSLWFAGNGEVKSLAYFTIIGRVDQFVLGVLAWSHRKQIVRHRAIAIVGIGGFLIAYTFFNVAGGANGLPVSGIWIILPTVEGAAFSLAIGLYDRPLPGAGVVSRLVGAIGESSYSIYLLHFFVIPKAMRFIESHILPLRGLGISIVAATATFLAFAPFAYLSFRLIECGFLRFRKVYAAPV